jgi:hypothetical protein
VREMLEIIGLLVRGTNTFQLSLGIMLIILSLKDIGVFNSGGYWIWQGKVFLENKMILVSYRVSRIS